MRLNSLRTNSHYNLEIVHKLNMSRILFSGLFIQNIFIILFTYTNLFTNVLVFCSCTKHINQIQISFENVFCHFTEFISNDCKKKINTLTVVCSSKYFLILWTYPNRPVDDCCGILELLKFNKYMASIHKLII